MSTFSFIKQTVLAVRLKGHSSALSRLLETFSMDWRYMALGFNFFPLWQQCRGHLVLAALAGLSLSLPAHSQTADHSALTMDAIKSPQTLALDWADRLFETALATQRAAGVVVVVADSEGNQLSRGYGYADALAGKEANPAETRFLMASVTKTFTALLILQLLESGLIASLDDPVNAYLRRATLPQIEGEDITVLDLLTHRNGLDLRGLGMVSDQPMDAPVSAEFVQWMMSKPVRARGREVVYSNLGFALLGAMAEDITGKTFADLMQENIFQPLAMHSSTLSYLPAQEPELAKAVEIQEDGSFNAIPFVANTPFMAPAGSVRASANDMGRYLSAQLQAARSQPSALFGTEFGPLLTMPTASNGAGLESMGLSYFLSDWNGQKVANHAGAFDGYSSQIVLLPDQGIGMLVAWVGVPAPGVAKPLGYDEVRDAFVERALGSYASPTPGQAGDSEPLKSLSGTYWRERRPHSGLGALLGLDSVSTVYVDEEDRLFVNNAGPYIAYADGSYRHQPVPGQSPDILTFSTAGGDILLQYAVDYGVLRKGWSDPLFLKQVLRWSWLVCLFAVLAVFWPSSGNNLARGSKWLAVLLAFWLAAIPALLYLGFPAGESIVSDLMRAKTARIDAFHYLLLGLPVFMVLLAAALVGHWTRPVWPGGLRATLARFHLTISTLSLAVLIYTAFYLGIFGPTT